MAESQIRDAIAVFAGATIATILILGSAGALKQRYSVIQDWQVLGAEYDEYDDANVTNYYFGDSDDPIA